MLRRLQAVARTLRPRALARTAKSVEDLARQMREVRGAADRVLAAESQLADRAARLECDLQALRQTLADLTLREQQLRAMYRRDAELARDLEQLPSILDRAAIERHFRCAVADATLELDPFPHLIVENAWPDRFYKALVRGIPPIELFADRPVNKQRLAVPFESAPLYSRRVWHFLANDVLDWLVAPALVEKLRGPLSEWVCSNWPMSSEEAIPALRLQSTDGRILLRRRGYAIRPHRDPKWGLITCLLYLARPGDSERWGTQLFSVADDAEAPGSAPYWIRAERCTLVKSVPFRRNAMLVFLNSRGAHGAEIPADAEPADLERYVYQFRIGPAESAIRALMQMLPDDRRGSWAGKLADYA